MYLKAFENIWLKFVLTCGWTFGSFPAKEPLQATRTYTFWSVINFMSISHLIFQVILGIIYQTTSPFLNTPMKFSQFLLTYVMQVLFSNLEITRKTFSVVHCTDVVYLLNVCSSNANDRYTSNKLILTLTLLSSSFLVLRKISNLVYFYSVDANLTLATSGMPIVDTFHRVCDLYSDISTAFSTYFCFSLLMILGYKLTCHFEGICRRFKKSVVTREKMYNACCNKNKSPKQNLNSLMEFNTMFIDTKNIFRVFNKVVGRLAFTFIFEYTFRFINCIYDIFWPGLTSGRVTNLLGIVESLLILFTLAHLGTSMELKVLLILFRIISLLNPVRQ